MNLAINPGVSMALKSIVKSFNLIILIASFTISFSMLVGSYAFAGDGTICEENNIDWYTGFVCLALSTSPDSRPSRAAEIPICVMSHSDASLISAANAAANSYFIRTSSSPNSVVCYDLKNERQFLMRGRNYSRWEDITPKRKTFGEM